MTSPLQRMPCRLGVLANAPTDLPLFDEYRRLPEPATFVVYVVPEALDAPFKERARVREEALALAEDRLKRPREWDDTMADRRALRAELSRVVDVEHGYACTVHKAQGSQWPQVLVLVDECFRKLADEDRPSARRWLYTAVTRAESKVIVGSLRSSDGGGGGR